MKEPDTDDTIKATMKRARTAPITPLAYPFITHLWSKEYC
jgi:hypothetical protein